MFDETFDDNLYTGKYTQTLSDYMKARDLNPFEESDRIEAIESLGGLKYTSVPVNVMDNLFNKIALRYMFNEFGTMSVDVFRLQLMSYFSDKESWYTKMFDLYSDLLPYDMLDETITTEGGETSDRTSNKTTTKNTSGEGKDIVSQTDDSEDTSTTTTTSEETTTLNGQTKVLGERGNNNTNTSTTDSEDTSTTTTTSEETTTLNGETKVIGNHVNSNTNTATTTKDIEEEKTTNERVVKGVGDVDSLTDPDVSVEGTNFVTRTETTKPSLGEDKTITSDEGTNTIDDTTTTTDTTGKTGGGSSNTINDGLTTTTSTDVGTNTVDDTTTTTDTTGKTGGGSSSTINGGLKTTNREDTKTQTGTESGSDLTTEGGEVNRTETVLKSGRVEWKPELARKFYEVYVGVDNEFVGGMRELFTVIY